MNNVDRINAIYAAFGKGDIASIIESTTEDVDWGYEGETQPVLSWLKAGKGRKKVIEYFDGVMKTMEFHAFVPRVVAGQGNDVLAVIDTDFTAVTTKKRVQCIESMWFTFDDKGRIARYRVILDKKHFEAYE